jgi:hypothetical protein
MAGHLGLLWHVAPVRLHVLRVPAGAPLNSLYAENELAVLRSGAVVSLAGSLMYVGLVGVLLVAACDALLPASLVAPLPAGGHALRQRYVATWWSGSWAARASREDWGLVFARRGEQKRGQSSRARTAQQPKGNSVYKVRCGARRAHGRVHNGPWPAACSRAPGIRNTTTIQPLKRFSASGPSRQRSRQPPRPKPTPPPQPTEGSRAGPTTLRLACALRAPQALERLLRSRRLHGLPPQTREQQVALHSGRQPFQHQDTEWTPRAVLASFSSARGSVLRSAAAPLPLASRALR